MSLARRVVEAPPSVRWHVGRLRTALYRRAFAAIGPGTVIVRPLCLRGVDRVSLGAGCAVYEGAWLQAEGHPKGSSRAGTGLDAEAEARLWAAAREGADGAG